MDVTHPSSLQQNSTVTIFIADDAGILGVLTLQFVASPLNEGYIASNSIEESHS